MLLGVRKRGKKRSLTKEEAVTISIVLRYALERPSVLLLCYFIVRVDTILAVGSRHPEVDEFGTRYCFCLFFDQFEPGRVK